MLGNTGFQTLHQHGKAASTKIPQHPKSSVCFAIISVESSVALANSAPIAAEPNPGPSNSFNITCTTRDVNYYKKTHVVCCDISIKY